MEIVRRVLSRRVLREVVLRLPAGPATGGRLGTPGGETLFLQEAHREILGQRATGIFPVRVRVRAFIYAPRPIRREAAAYDAGLARAALVGYLTGADDDDHVEGVEPVLIELPRDARGYMELVVTPIAPLPGDLP